jgi:hypothetical protein
MQMLYQMNQHLMGDKQCTGVGDQAGRAGRQAVTHGVPGSRTAGLMRALNRSSNSALKRGFWSAGTCNSNQHHGPRGCQHTVVKIQGVAAALLTCVCQLAVLKQGWQQRDHQTDMSRS